MATTPINPTPCQASEVVLRTVDVADIKAVLVDSLIGQVVVVADLIETSSATTCRSITLRFFGVTVTNALALAPAGPAVLDAIIKLGTDLVVAFFDGSVPATDVDAIGIDLDQEVQRLLDQALRNGKGGAI